jgi:Protein of unknown function (DUF3027)
VIVSPTTTRQAELDQACADAVDLARAAAEDDAGPGQVGAHVGTGVEGDRVVTHVFESLNPGYVGWRWAVTVTRASRSKTVTVSESVLLPGTDALLAPDWVPWTERVRPGDLKAGDLLPARSDDERLVPLVAIAGDAGLLDWDENDAWRLPDLEAGDAAEPGAAAAAPTQADGPAQAGDSGGSEAGETGQPQQSQAGETGQPQQSQAGETGQAQQSEADTSQPKTAGRAGGALAEPRARPQGGSRSRSRRRSGPSRDRERSPGQVRPSRVLSATGRDDAAFRWHTGEHGPKSELAAAAPANCLTCGFMVRLSGPLGRVFGVCANEFAPDDGTVVSVDHGCGAHSDGAVVPEASAPDMAAPKVDELGYDMLNTGATVPESVLETLDHEQL